MKNSIALFLCFAMYQLAISQTYFTRTGNTEFKASVQAFESVEAKNNSTTAIFKTKTGELAAQLFIHAFNFKVALMQEHFNENYMDSDKFPKSVFKGKLQDFDFENFSKEQEYNLTGTLTIRGISKKINSKASLKKLGETIQMKTSFTVQPQEFDIVIPSIIRKKIADNIMINIHYELVKKK